MYAKRFKLQDQSAIQHHRQKVRCTVSWISNFGYTSTDVIMQVLGIQNTSFLRTLTKKKIVRIIKSDYCPFNIFMLTPYGVSIAAQDSELVPDRKPLFSCWLANF